MRDLECEFKSEPCTEDVSVCEPQITQVWFDRVLIVTAIVMASTAARILPEPCHVDHRLILRYRIEYGDYVAASVCAFQLVFRISDLKKVRPYEVELCCVECPDAAQQ